MSNSVYLKRYAWPDPLFPDYEPHPDLGLVVVIPSYKEEHLRDALISINQCTKPKSRVLLIVLINEPESAHEEVRSMNWSTYEEVANYHSEYETLVALKQLPDKKAGVGLARKIGMDEAVRLFNQLNQDGVIICYDADCTCEPNYLVSIEQQFSDSRLNAGIVFYEHQLNDLNSDYVIAYETYLRYYINALRFAAFPYAHQTLGSCIVARSSVYQKQGGMNTRKAGEDFYFLNKVIPLGNFTEINTTTVYPSGRTSDRVPFGTGKAIREMIHSDQEYLVYNPKCFQDLNVFFKQKKAIWDQKPLKIPASLQAFLGDNHQTDLQKLRKQTASEASFYQRFFHWFNAFQVLKYVHFARDHFYPSVTLDEAMAWLDTSFKLHLSADPTERLKQLRNYDRKFAHSGTRFSDE